MGQAVMVNVNLDARLDQELVGGVEMRTGFHLLFQLMILAETFVTAVVLAGGIGLDENTGDVPDIEHVDVGDVEPGFVEVQRIVIDKEDIDGA